MKVSIIILYIVKIMWTGLKKFCRAVLEMYKKAPKVIFQDRKK